MQFAQILQSIKGQCRYRHQQAGFFHWNHQDCQETHQAGWQEMVSLVTQATADHSFNETALRQSLSAIANRSRATGEDIERSLEEGFAQGVAQAMADGIITRDEEERLRAFRDRSATVTVPMMMSGTPTRLPGPPSPGEQRRRPGRVGQTGPSRGGPGHAGSPAGSHLRAGRGRPPTGPRPQHQTGRPGKRPSRRSSRTASSPWTRRTPWPNTQATSPWPSRTWTGTASRPASCRLR